MSDPFSLPKEEYLSLRKEIETSLSELSALERNSLFAIAAVYSWLVVHSGGADGHHYVFTSNAWAIPFLIAIFGAYSAYSINLHLGMIGRYLREVEMDSRRRGDLSENLGWEHYFDGASRGAQTKVRMVFWGALALVTLLVWI